MASTKSFCGQNTLRNAARPAMSRLCIPSSAIKSRRMSKNTVQRCTSTTPDTGEITNAYLFVGIMTYRQYPYVEAPIDEKQSAWITAHVHMYEYFGGVAKILGPDNGKTAVDHNHGWKDQRIIAIYKEMAEYHAPPPPQKKGAKC